MCENAEKGDILITHNGRVVNGETKWWEWFIAIPLYVLFVPYLIYLRFTTKKELNEI
jgi:hypothetical protein